MAEAGFDEFVERLRAPHYLGGSHGAGAMASSDLNEQCSRMEFNLQVFTPKLSGKTGMKYSVEVTRDFLTLERRTAMQETCYAGNRPLAEV